MNRSSLPDTGADPTAVAKLFDDKPPVLVEVRFPNMGASSDWFLCEDQSALDVILDRLAAGAEVHLTSVWELTRPANGIVLRASKAAGFQPDSDSVARGNGS